MDSDVEFFTYLIKISRFGFWKVRWTKQGVTPKNWMFRKGIYELILVPTLFYNINLPQNWFLQPIWCEQKLMQVLPWVWAEAPKSFPATRLQDSLLHLLSEEIFFILLHKTNVKLENQLLICRSPWHSQVFIQTCRDSPAYYTINFHRHCHLIVELCNCVWKNLRTLNLHHSLFNARFGFFILKLQKINKTWLEVWYMW